MDTEHLLPPAVRLTADIDDCDDGPGNLPLIGRLHDFPDVTRQCPAFVEAHFSMARTRKAIGRIRNNRQETSHVPSEMGIGRQYRSRSVLQIARAAGQQLEPGAAT